MSPTTYGLQYLHAADPTDIPANGDIPVYSTAASGYVPTAGINGNVTAAATLTSNAIIIGQGTTAVAALGSLGTTTTLLHGNAAGSPTFATVVEADITLADNTTNNSSTSAHGFLKKLNNSATSFMNGQGDWAVPAGAGNVTTSETLTSGVSLVGNGTQDIKKSTLTATVVKSSSGTLSAATDGTDYLSPATGWTFLGQVVTASSASTADFSSISSSYSQLKVLYMAQSNTAGTGGNDMYMKVNNDGTSGNYTASRIVLGATGASASSTTTAASSSGQHVGYTPASGNTSIPGTGEITLVGYKQTTFHKRWFSVIAHEDGTAVYTGEFSGRWKATTAINQLTFSIPGTTFLDGSTFTLYGIP